MSQAVINLFVNTYNKTSGYLKWKYISIPFDQNKIFYFKLSLLLCKLQSIKINWKN